MEINLLTKHQVHCEDSEYRIKFRSIETFKGRPESSIYVKYRKIYNDPQEDTECVSTGEEPIFLGKKFVIYHNPDIEKFLTYCSPYYLPPHPNTLAILRKQSNAKSKIE